MLPENNEHIIAFGRVAATSKKRVAVIGNTNYTSSETVTVKVDTSKKLVTEMLSKARLAVKENQITITLQPGQCLVFEY
jgi:predicted metalloenzyme YecM